MDTMNNITNEYESFEQDLRAALPVLAEIADLDNAASTLSQRLQMEEGKRREFAAKMAGAKAAVIAVVLYMGLTVILKTVIYWFVSKTGWDLLIPLYCIVGIGTCIKVFFQKKKMFKNTVLKESEKEYSMIRQQKAILVEMERISDENSERLNMIPETYRYYDAALFMVQALESGRAENKKEAINLYEEELHRRRLEANSSAALKNQQEQSRMLSNIQDNSAATARHSGVSAFLSALSFLDRM